MKLITYLQTTHGLSRRTITEMIKQGKIQHNGSLVEAFGTEIASGDTITIEDKSTIYRATTTQKSELLLFHKPLGYVVSRSDPHNPTIFDLFPEGYAQQWYPVGRLDKESTGLLILVNHPAQVDLLLHPRHQLHKIYEVIISGSWKSAHTPLAMQGCLVTDQGTAPAPQEHAQLLKVIALQHASISPGKTLLTITLGEGKKRHIRRLLHYLRYHIISLHRISFGPRQLGDLPVGKRKKNIFDC